VTGEISSLIEMMNVTYEAFGLGKPRFMLSLRPDKRIGSDELWDTAEGALRDALQQSGMQFTEQENEGAFYGPKIDLFMDDVLGREWQISTFQLDFNMPERFELQYAAEDGTLQRPVMIHRAILGSIERFMGILIEQTAGAFQTWLAPVQATLIPIADRHVEYCEGVAARLRAAGLRVEVDGRNERMQAKIRDAQMMKVPYMLIAGDRDAAAEAVSVRTRANQDLGGIEVSKVIEMIMAEVTSHGRPEDAVATSA
jgi:threonyl-tRNA synthetase